MNCDRCVVLGADALGGRADAFLLVADGMGATVRGDTASLMVAEMAPPAVVQALEQLPATPSTDDLAAVLRSAVNAANLAVWRRGQEQSELRGMGTTCIACLVRDGRAVIAHAGDSRAYVLRDGELMQLTADHSLVQEVAPADDTSGSLEARFGTVVTRGVGLSRVLDLDVEAATFGPDDVLLLCTDGLTGMLRESAIARALARAEDVEAACDSLIAEANAAGGEDNIGVAVARSAAFVPYELGEASEPVGSSVRTSSRRRSSRRSRGAAMVGWRAVALVLLLVCVALGVLLAQSSREVSRLRAALEEKPHRSGSPLRAGTP